MKNRTFTLIISWVVIWTLLAVITFLFRYGLEIMALLYVISGISIIFLIIREEFFKGVKNAF